MTCIVGVETENGKVVMGGDVLGSNGHSKSEYSESKVYKHSKMIFGYTSTYRFGQIVELMLDDNEIYIPEDPSDIYGWLVRVFVPKLRKTLTENGSEGGYMLMGIKGQLWSIQSDFSVLRAVRGYNSVGSGDTFAKGSMYTQVNLNGLPSDVNAAKKMVALAIEAAGNLCTSVSATSTVVVL